MLWYILTKPPTDHSQDTKTYVVQAHIHLQLKLTPCDSEIKSCFVLSKKKYFKNISHMRAVIMKLLR